MSCVNGVFCGEFLEVLHVNEKSLYYFLEVCNVHVEGIHVHGETIHVDGEVTFSEDLHVFSRFAGVRLVSDSVVCRHYTPQQPVAIRL
jgi:hypothetical protein